MIPFELLLRFWALDLIVPFHLIKLLSLSNFSGHRSERVILAVCGWLVGIERFSVSSAVVCPFFERYEVVVAQHAVFVAVHINKHFFQPLLWETDAQEVKDELKLINRDEPSRINIKLPECISSLLEFDLQFLLEVFKPVCYFWIVGCDGWVHELGSVASSLHCKSLWRLWESNCIIRDLLSVHLHHLVQVLIVLRSTSLKQRKLCVQITERAQFTRGNSIPQLADAWNAIHQALSASTFTEDSETHELKPFYRYAFSFMVAYLMF